LEDRGFHHYNNWIKLYRDVTLLTPVRTDLAIREIGTEYGDAFGRIIVASFEWPDRLYPWVGATVGRPGWHHYMAFDGETPVATGAVYCRGEVGWIDFASTLSSHRGRGAQAALVEQRIRDAAALGCKWLIVETAEETPDKPAPSFRNMVRYGFKAAYARPNYLFQFET
jgi:GNAT superfamily N-acetyltransferase